MSVTSEPALELGTSPRDATGHGANAHASLQKGRMVIPVTGCLSGLVDPAPRRRAGPERSS